MVNRPANLTSFETLRLIYYSSMVDGALSLVSALCRHAYLFTISGYAK